jgi:hypothetical protein
MNAQSTTPFEHHHHPYGYESGWWRNKGISWGAIFAGALVVIGLGFLLNLFSIAMGLSIYYINPEGLTKLAVGGFTALLIGIIITMFVGGFTAGYVGRSCCLKHNSGVIYGFTTWVLALLLTALLTTHIGRYLTSYSNFIEKPTIIVATADETLNKVGKPAEVTVTEEKVAEKTALGAFIIFSLFFVGALASCFGGYCGVGSCRKEGCTPPLDVKDVK